jgi:biopolymer transport protein ExbB
MNPTPVPSIPVTLPHDLSPIAMFLAADWVVKAVMIILALASVATWTVLVAKAVEIAATGRAIRRALARLGAATSLAEALRDVRADWPGSFLQAAAREIELSAGTPAEGVKERVASRLDRLEAAASRRLARGTGILATIGSVAPFVGLFGTVWGIMNSFIGIARSETTNLAVVAPGIAQALLATAIGLVAAIPAVTLYNVFARSIGGTRALLADTSAEIQRLVSRDLDRARSALRRAAE